MSSRYFEPLTVDEAVGLAGEYGAEACFVAGGTDLVVRARKTRSELPPVLIALHRVAGLDGVAIAGDGSLRLGATASHADLMDSPLVVESYTALADGTALVGSPATRHVGTLGGNLCNASPANDTGSPLLAFGASVELASSRGRRELPLEDFFVGPGRVSLEVGEILVAVRLPGGGTGESGSTWSGSGESGTSGASGSAYIRLDYRRAMEIAVVGAAVAMTLGEDGIIASASVALTAVAPTCLLVPAVGSFLAGRQPTPEVLQEAAELARAVAVPIDDVRAPAGYRAAMVPVIVGRALACALRRARGEVLSVPATLSVAFGPSREAA